MDRTVKTEPSSRKGRDWNAFIRPPSLLHVLNRARRVIPPSTTDHKANVLILSRRGHVQTERILWFRMSFYTAPLCILRKESVVNCVVRTRSVDTYRYRIGRDQRHTMRCYPESDD